MRVSAIIIWSSALALAAPSGRSQVAGAPLSVASPEAAPGPLSRTQAVDEALAHNPALAAAREQVEEAKAGISVATAWADPSLVTEADQLKNFLSPRSASERDVGLQFTVPNPARTRLNGKVARGSWRQMQLVLLQLQQQTAAQTAQAYDALLVARRHQDDLNQSQEMARQILKTTEARYRAGTAARLDALKAKVDYSKATNLLIANEHARTTAQAALNRLLGRPINAACKTADSLEIPDALPDLAAVQVLALNSRPELLSASVQQQAARDSTTLAKQYWLPDLNLTLWRSHIVGAPDSYKFDGGISVPLFFWQHEQGAVAQARHHERELSASGADLSAQVALDVQTAYSAAATALRQVAYLRDELVPQAKAAYHAAFESYTLGGSSSLELLDAKATMLDAESQLTDALGAASDAQADLERAVGAPLPSAPTGAPHEK
ncbi:MAG TPA: TolC family protein [Candidatus Didemnitutus sp.]|jgi:cobalt-zinc-cadmium efflux system outer membrane protein